MSTHSNRSLIALALVISFSLGALLGCSDDNPTNTKIADPAYEVSSTPDLVIENFARAYSEMNFAEYEKLIHDDFEFFFADDDVTELGLEEPSWNRITELAATQRMFSGEAGVDPLTGSIVPPVVEISLTLTPQSPSWGDPPGDPIFEGTFMRIFEARVTVSYQGQDPTPLSGLQEFYVENVAPLGDPARYQLKYWRDRGSGIPKAGVETVSWGTVKAQFGG